MNLQHSSDYYLGCDISLTSPGFAIIELQNGKPKLVDTFNVKTTSKHSYAQRLELIQERLAAWLTPYGAIKTVIREKFASPNPNTSYSVFAAWGSVDRGLWDHDGLTVSAGVAQSRVKKLLTGKGKCEKEEVAAAVKVYLGLPEDYRFGSSDESDACAVVIAYLIEEGIIAA